MFIGIPNKEVKAEMETHPVFEPKINSESVQNKLDLYKPFYAFYLSISFNLCLN